MKQFTANILKLFGKLSIWSFFVAGLCFFLLGIGAFYWADKKSEFGLWGDKPTAYTREKAAARAMYHLAQQAEKQNIPLYEFQGPYFKPMLGLEKYIPCMVYYKHSKYGFMYDDWTGKANLFPRGSDETDSSWEEEFLEKRQYPKNSRNE